MCLYCLEKQYFGSRNVYSMKCSFLLNTKCRSGLGGEDGKGCSSVDRFINARRLTCGYVQISDFGLTLGVQGEMPQ